MKYILTIGKETGHCLAINNTVIPEQVLEKRGIEYDDREGYLSHLEENANNSHAINEYRITKGIEDDFILIKRTDGPQEVLVPGSSYFKATCETLIQDATMLKIPSQLVESKNSSPSNPSIKA